MPTQSLNNRPRTARPGSRGARPGRAVAAALLACGAAAAREPPAPVRIAPVVVEASRVPGAATGTPWPVTVVEGPALTRARQGLALDEALATVPGLYAQNRYNFAQDLRLSLRGFGANATFGIRGVRVVVDGVPATLPDGQTGVDAIDPASLARVEVIRGPAASLYGASAGGVVSLTTRAPPAGREAGVSFAAGSFGYREQRMHAGATRPASCASATRASTVSACAPAPSARCSTPAETSRSPAEARCSSRCPRWTPPTPRTRAG